MSNNWNKEFVCGIEVSRLIQFSFVINDTHVMYVLIILLAYLLVLLYLQFIVWFWLNHSMIFLPLAFVSIIFMDNIEDDLQLLLYSILNFMDPFDFFYFFFILNIYIWLLNHGLWELSVESCQVFGYTSCS